MTTPLSNPIASPLPDAEPADPGSRPFIIYSIGHGTSALGNWMQKTAVGWLSWELTHSPAWVGAIALCDFIAALWVAPLAGAIADRHNPFRLLMGSQLAMALLALLLWGLLASGSLTIWLLFGWALLDATLKGFNQPVRMLSIGLLAGAGRMSQAIAANSVAANLARILGPALAGLVMLTGQVQDVLVLNVLSYAAMVVAVLLVRQRLNRAGAVTRREPLLGQIVEGFGYVRHSPVIANLFALTIAFALLARPFTELFPALAGAVFQGGPDTLSMMMSAQGVGALCGAIWLLRRGHHDRLAPLAVIASLGITAALIALAFVDSLRWVLVVIAAAGLFHVMCNIALQSMTQLYCESTLRGRVMALYGLIFWAMPALGAFIIGVSSQWIPLPTLLGLGAALFGLFVLWRARRLVALPGLSAIVAR